MGSLSSHSLQAHAQSRSTCMSFSATTRSTCMSFSATFIVQISDILRDFGILWLVTAVLLEQNEDLIAAVKGGDIEKVLNLLSADMDIDVNKICSVS